MTLNNSMYKTESTGIKTMVYLGVATVLQKKNVKLFFCFILFCFSLGGTPIDAQALLRNYS